MQTDKVTEARGNGQFDYSKHPISLIEPAKRKNQTFPQHVFPMELKKYIQDKSAHGYPPEAFAANILGAFAGAIGGNYLLEFTPVYESISNLIIIVYGDMGSNKTEPYKEALRPIREFDEKLRLQYLDDLKQWNQSLPEGRGEKPRKREIVLNNVTFEALKDRLMYNKNGLLIGYDESRGFFQSLNQYRRGGDKQTLLSMWSGEGFKDTRKDADRDTSAISTRLTFVGNTQATLLHKSFGDEIEPDGLLDRVCFQRITKRRRINQMRINATSDDHAKVRYHETLKFLLSNQNDVPIKLSRSVEATEVFTKYFDMNNSRIEVTNHPFYPGLYAKADILLGRFALILQVVHSIYSQEEIGILSGEIAQYAVDLTEHFIEQGKDAYNTILELKQLDPEGQEKVIGQFLVDNLGYSKSKAGQTVGKSDQWGRKFLNNRVASSDTLKD